MSTITTSPSPSIGRKPVVIGLVALGVVTVGVVTVPRLHVDTTATPAPVAAPSPAPADFLDRHDAMVAAQQAQSAVAAQKLLDSQARGLAGRAVPQQQGTSTSAHLTELTGLATAYGAASTSLGREQIGQYHRTYTWTPATAQRNALSTTDAKEQVGGLQGSYEFAPSKAQAAAVTSLMAEQVGGLHETYAYNGRGLEKVTPVQVYDGRALRLTWSDNWVPPVDNPDWTPFIRAHYYGGTVPERIVTRGD
jgi:hypothetical protein